MSDFSYDAYLKSQTPTAPAKVDTAPTDFSYSSYQKSQTSSPTPKTAPVVKNPAISPDLTPTSQPSLFSKTFSAIGGGIKSFFQTMAQTASTPVADMPGYKESARPKYATVDGITAPIDYGDTPALRGKIIGSDIKPEDLNSTGKTLNDTAALLHTQAKTIDKTNKKSVDDYNAQVKQFMTDASQYDQNVKDYNVNVGFMNNIGKDERLASEIISKDPTQSGFEGIVKSAFIPTQFINSADSSLLNNARAQEHAKYTEEHPILSAVAQGVGQLANLILIGKAGGGFGLAETVSEAAGPLKNSFPVITRMLGLGAESGSIFGIESFLSTAINQAGLKEFKPGELAKNTLIGVGSGVALGGAGSLPTLAERTIAGGATLTGLTAFEALLRHGTIDSKDATNMIISAILGAGFELVGGREKTDLFRTAEMSSISKEQIITKMTSSMPSISTAEAETLADAYSLTGKDRAEFIKTSTQGREGLSRDSAERLSSIMNELHYIAKSGLYQKMPAAYEEAFKNLPVDFNKGTTELKMEYFKNVAGEVASGKTIAQAIDAVNQAPVITPSLKAEVQNAIKENGPVGAYQALKDELGIDGPIAQNIIKRVMNDTPAETPAETTNTVEEAHKEAMAEVSAPAEATPKIESTAGISATDLEKSIDDIFARKEPEIKTQEEPVIEKTPASEEKAPIAQEEKPAKETTKIPGEKKDVVPAKTRKARGKKVAEPQAYTPVSTHIEKAMIDAENRIKDAPEGYQKKSAERDFKSLVASVKEQGNQKATTTGIDGHEVNRGDFVQYGARVMIFDSLRSNGKILMSDPHNKLDYTVLADKADVSIPSKDRVISEYERIGQGEQGWPKLTNFDEAVAKLSPPTLEEKIDNFDLKKDGPTLALMTDIVEGKLNDTELLRKYKVEETLKDLTYSSLTKIKEKMEEEGITKENIELDIASDSNIIKGNDNRDKQGAISDTSDLSPRNDKAGSGEATSEISGYDRATMLTQSGNGSKSDRPASIGKKGRQLINQQVEELLEAREYSTNPEDYSEEDRQLMANYTGAGGKESAGAEGAGLLNEYYTPPQVIDAIWNIVKKLAPDAETAFEPSAGTGRFISLAPSGIDVSGIEISKVSGTIASILNPDSKITIGDFQELFFDKKTNKQLTPEQYDVVVGNPPFGARAGFLKGKGEESNINREEEYFIKRGLDMTKNGGHLVYVVNSSFLKTGMSDGKKAIAEIGKLVSAYRLPENIFDDTSIGTDIVIFEKNPTTSANKLHDRFVSTSGDNFFYALHPENVLGEQKVRRNRFGQTEGYVEGNLETALKSMETLSGPLEETSNLSNEPENTPLKTEKTSLVKKNIQEKKAPKISQTIQPDKALLKGTVPVQNISNKIDYSPIEVNMLKRIDRDLAIQDPTPDELPFLNYAGGEYFNDGIYYSGEIRQKLTQLENDKQNIIDKFGQEQYDKQKAGLEKVLPQTIPIKDIVFDPLDRHIGEVKTTDEDGQDSNVLNVFASWIRQNDVALSPRVSKWDVLRYVRGENAAKETKPIMGYIKSDAKRLFNHFLKNELDPETSQAITEKYNREKNSYVQPDYTKIPVEVKNMSKQFNGRDFHLSPLQKNGIGFLVNKGSGLIAYGVGVGKTHTLAVATVANMQKGWTKRPLFVVPKSTIQKTWLFTLQSMFPGLTINNLEGLQAPVIARLKREKGEDKTQWIKDGELSVISHEGILRLGLGEEELRQATADLRDALWIEPKSKRGAEKTKSAYDEIAGNAQKYVTDVMIKDLGFDHISVDEVHNFRKVFQGAKAEKVDEEGKAYGKKRYANILGGTPSRRAQQLFLLSQYIQKNNNNRNVFLASATPFENHATEVYNILSFIARDRMRSMGLLNINDFFASFANFEVELDRKLDGEWINREKMKSFSNLPTLQGLLKEFIDYQEDSTLVRPDRKVITPHLPMGTMQVANLAKIQNLLKGVKDEVDNEDAFDKQSEEFFNVAQDVEEGAFLKASTYSIANSVSPYFIKEYTKEAPNAETLVKESPKIEYAIEALRKIKADEKTKDFGTFLFFGKMGVEYHPMIAGYIVKELGYAKDEVAVLSGDVSDDEKEMIKEKFNDGRVKVLIGGDQTKEGIDLQRNGFMTINLALGWNPTQISQVEGRVWRQGNHRNIAPLVYPLVENSGDSTIFNKFEEKGGRINDLFSYKGKMFDVGEIDPAEKKLALLTDPKDKAKMQIEIDKTGAYNERLLLENDIKELKNIQADQNQTKEDTEYYTKELKNGVDAYGNPLTEAEVKNYKKELKSAKDRAVRLAAKLENKGIKDINQNINDLEVKIIEMDAKIKEIDKTYEEKLSFFTKQYREDVKNRKTLDDHMKDIQGLIDQLEERTPEEIKALRDKKIANTQGENTAPDYSEVKQFSRSLFNQEIKIPIAEARQVILDNIGKEGYTKKDLLITFSNDMEEGASGTFHINKYLQNIIELYEEDGKTGLVETLHESKHFLFQKLPASVQNEAFDLAKQEMGPLYRVVLQKVYPKVGLYAGENREKALLEEFIVDKWSKSDAARDFGYQKSVYGKVFDFIDNLLKTLTDTYKSVMKVLSAMPNKQGGFIKVGPSEKDSFEEQNKEYKDQQKETIDKAFTDIEKKGYDISLIRRDMNRFDALFAQSRDLYLKDPVEFKEADLLMKIGDERRMKKSLLDNKFTGILKPYFDLKEGQKGAINTILMEGDEEQKEYSDFQLINKGLSLPQIEGYKAVRKGFNVAHELLLSEMEANGVKPEEIDTFRAERTGYMPHKWTGRYVIKTQNLKMGGDPKDDKSWRTESMDSYETKSKMEKAYEAMRADNKEENVRFVKDTLDSLDVDFFSEQRFSFENMKSVISKARMASEIKTEMLKGLRNMVKEKGFGRNFLKRTGVQGYEQKEIPSIIANYIAGLDGFLTKMEAGKKYYGVLEGIDARRQKKFYAWTRESIAYDMGNQVDTFNIRIPFTSIRMDVKQFAFVYFLANDLSFLLTNATQNITIGLGELSKLTNGAGKIYKAETALIKAVVDWTTNNVTPEEKLVATQLLKVGRLGGEMTAELMGFKNNPVYQTISSGMNKFLYNSTSFVEQNVNRVPAFIAARRLLKEQGLSDKEANERALSVSDDINFRYGKQHRPVYMRGRKSVLFVFTHYMRSFLYQLSRDLKEKEFTSFIKKLFYIFLLGGAAALPFATEIKNIYQWIAGPTPTDGQKETLGTFQLAIDRGVPASLLNIDMSSRVGIDILSLNSVLDGTTTGTLQNLAQVKTYLGAMGSIFLDRIPKGFSLLNQGRYLEAGGKLLPDFIGNPMRAWAGAATGVQSQAGNPLIDANGDRFKYTTYEGFIKALGFTPTREQLAWDEQNKQWNLKNANTQSSSAVQQKVAKMVRAGDIEGARAYQEQAQKDGLASPNSNYVKKAVEDNLIRDKVTEWNSGPQTQGSLNRMEKEIASTVYGPKYTSQNLTGVSKEFAFRRVFGYNDPNAEALKSAVSNKQKLQVLNETKAKLSPDDFRTFFNNGRKTVQYPSGGSGNVLISDNLKDAYIHQRPEDIQASLTAPKSSGTSLASGTYDKQSFITHLINQAKALGTDPVSLFNDDTSGEHIVRVENGTVYVERMPKDASQAIKASQGGANSAYKLDHTVPLELGGTNSKDNLRLVSTAEWASYTPVENYLGKMLTSGKITKGQAQDAITKFKNGTLTFDDVKNTYR